MIAAWVLLGTSPISGVYAHAQEIDGETYQLPTRQFDIKSAYAFVTSGGVTGQYGYVYTSGSAVFRYDGVNWDCFIPLETTAITSNGKGMIYCAGSTNFRFEETTGAVPNVVPLNDVLRKAGLENVDSNLFKDASRVGDEVFLTRTLGIARLGFDSQGQDVVQAILKVDALPEDLKFRRVFSVGGRPMVQLEDTKRMIPTEFGWLTPDNTIERIPGLIVEDHVISCHELPPESAAADDGKPRFFAFGANKMHIIEGTQVHSFIPDVVTLGETMKTGAFPIGPNRFAMVGRRTGLSMFDSNGATLYRYMPPRTEELQIGRISRDNSGTFG